MQNLEGKILLILGAGDKWDSTTEVDAVRYAHEMGLYVIVADSQVDWNRVPAKFDADEAWDVSWSNVDELIRLCREKKVDGVFAGFSERRVLSAAKLSHALGLPFYAEGADIATIFDKRKFKEACLSVGIDVPRSFEPNDSIKFPVVVKPIDNAGGRGISVCCNEEELKEGISKALEFSNALQPEIEEFIDGSEVFVYYVIRDGVPAFSMASEIGTIRDDDTGLAYFVANRFPSCFAERIYSECDEKFKQLIKKLNINNCYLGLQCFVTEDRIIVHDPTFRVDGSNVHEIMQMITGVNAVKLTIAYSLIGRFGEEADKNSLCYRNDWPIFLQTAIALRPGVIGRFEGLDKAARVEGVYEIEQLKHVGDEMEFSSANLSKIAAQIKIQAPNENELKKRLAEIYSRISVEDINGKDMLIPLDIMSFVS